MNLLQMSLSAAILILLITCMRLLLKKKLPRWIFSILWGFALIKSLIPISFPSIPTLWKENELAAPAMAAIEAIETFRVPTGIFMEQKHMGFQLKDLALTIWLSVACLLVIYFIYSYYKWIKRFKTALPAKDAQFLQEWVALKHLHRTFKILVSDRITVPLTYGIWHPIILLPKSIDWDDETGVTFILEHEFAHIKRFDAVWKPLLSAALAIHWFNPLMWLMFLLANRDMELACDEMVIQTTGYQNRASYANLLVEWELRKQKNMTLLPNFIQHSIEERIISIMKMKRISIAGIILSLTLTGGVATAFAVVPSTMNITKSPAIHSALDVLTAEDKRLEDDKTLGGIFETYTYEEYKEVVKNTELYSDGGSTGMENMKKNLELLKADNGKGEFVVYKPFLYTEVKNNDGIETATSITPIFIMASEQSGYNLTKEEYSNEIKSITIHLDKAVKDGSLTAAQKALIIDKMNDNLAKM